MLFNIIVALSLSTSVSAWIIPDLRKSDDSTLTNKACNKALEKEIHCDKFLSGVMSDDDSKWTKKKVELADSVCTDTCYNSLQSWYDTVTDACDNGEDNYLLLDKVSHTGFGGNLWASWNETCVKDPRTGRYCQEIIDGFSEIDDGEQRPYDELCHPCYGKVITAMTSTPSWLLSSNPGTDYWNGQLELVHKICGSSDSSKSRPFLIGTEISKEEHSSGSNHGITSTPSSDASTVSVQRTSSTGTASLETALSEIAPLESNAAGTFGAEHLDGYKYALLALGVDMFIL
ncbi:hypothetical protein FPOAC2_08702 [Fusarium poae]|uniref:LysM domain-containing protein n=1 Tax=Fusarium poae TaxID=36050 RepID=A0A1B8AM50_FUSPO|nr:hypothetical protein FPOAC1_008769 [Fusarium poae]KAG8669374.1 hypothetical protein FPOAC1_008769 [Fusarium poae]OBS21603.1 hypothetical protein FPOA_07939 [Fusarium poae]